MDNDSTKALVDFLKQEAQNPPEEVIVVNVAPEIKMDAAMTMLMARLKVVGMEAKDLHYRAKGNAFFSLHEMADLIWDMDRLTDNIAELYFLGVRAQVPPLMHQVYGKAIQLPCKEASDLPQFISRLRDSVVACIREVEQIKKTYPELISGVVALLDEISQKSLLALGFLERTLKN